jgi:hypothetical protein
MTCVVSRSTLSAPRCTRVCPFLVIYQLVSSSDGSRQSCRRLIDKMTCSTTFGGLVRSTRLHTGRIPALTRKNSLPYPGLVLRMSRPILEDLVPKMGWSKLQKIYGPTHSPELWLIGKQLPAIFIRYFGRSKGPNRARQGHSRCDGFVVDVLEYAGIKTNKNKPYAADSVEKYRRRARTPEGFELTDKVN